MVSVNNHLTELDQVKEIALNFFNFKGSPQKLFGEIIPTLSPFLNPS